MRTAIPRMRQGKSTLQWMPKPETGFGAALYPAESGEGTETADTIGKSLRVRVSVNGISANSLTTLLEDDLTLYHEELNPGESREAVILAEYEAMSLLDVASVEINVKNDDKNATILLQ